ncbi:hypothetical protein H4W32_007484 [Actinophytocola algeriensis]|uniref:Uncharacterized protein n=1 Tax=Actinophytocola algeriensis TaxID=1768010 RepID=A0A7W7Q5G2_9PSEU|nr:hypothetical protein [Actinophytocola algeriensis]MBE1479442.1 hypothetical protein [Actinophytocola algeriensis]
MLGYSPPPLKPAVREVADKVFRTACTTGAVTGSATGVVGLHEAGFR